MPDQEWSRGWKRYLDSSSGGAISGPSSFENGRVAVSPYGEFSCSVGEEGELIVFFPQLGVISGYTDDNKLAFLNIDVATFLDRVTPEVLSSMANKGKDIEALLDAIPEEQTLFLRIMPNLNLVNVEMESHGEVVADEEYTEVDLRKGFDGTLSIGEAEIVCRSVRRGDELIVMLGERVEEKTTLVPLYVSTEVDYMKEIGSNDPRRYWNLANNILLNG